MRNLLMILVALGLGTKRHWHIFLAILLGFVFGYLLPYDPHYPTFYHHAFEVIGQIFIRMISMLVIPLIISSLLIGLTSLGDGRQLGKLGVKTVFFFSITMLFSSAIAATLALVLKPGVGVPTDLNISLLVSPFESMRHGGGIDSLSELFINLIPQNPFEALSRGNMVPVIVFVLIFGTAMAFVGDTARPFIAFFEAVFAATMKMVDWIMILAVPGVFALTFTAISHGGPRILTEMFPFMLTVLTALLVQVMITYPILLRVFAKVNFVDLYRAISEAMLVAFGTASSSATLPVSLASMERRAGVSNRIASFVLPTGTSMNMNGTTSFEVIAVIFLAQMYGVPLTVTTVLSIVILAIVASIGAAGVPSAGLITMSIIINAIGQFEQAEVFQGLSLFWAVDRILDMCRTTVNVIDDCVVATLIAASEGELNRDMLTSGEGWEDVV